MGRTEWCELVSGVCHLTAGAEWPEGLGHVSAWLSAEPRMEQRSRNSRIMRSTGLTRASPSVESTGEQPVG